MANDLIQGLRDQKFTEVRSTTHNQDIAPVIHSIILASSIQKV
jgi:hypothetical protein